MKKQLLQILFLCVTGILPVFSQEDILKDTQKMKAILPFIGMKQRVKYSLKSKILVRNFFIILVWQKVWVPTILVLTEDCWDRSIFLNSKNRKQTSIN